MVVSKPKERPIIFSSESVQQILAGRKTMTRRALRQPKRRDGAQLLPELLQDIGVGHACPYGAVGERLWVKEAFVCIGDDLWSSWVEYRDGGAQRLMKSSSDLPDWWKIGKRQSPLFMPRWASRITLELTEVRVERLMDISLQDAIAEGYPDLDHWQANYTEHPDDYIRNAPISYYKSVWQSLNAKRGFPWESNPWVWVLGFKLLSPERS